MAGYEFGFLSAPSEEWFDHCATVFDDTPRTYDPFKCDTQLLVATLNGRIAATVKVYRRKIYLSGLEIEWGGMGEVSTKEEHRGKGLALQLLQKATEHMIKQNIPISALSTSPSTMPLYQKAGWEGMKLPFSYVNEVTPEKAKSCCNSLPFCFDDLAITRATFSKVNSEVQPILIKNQLQISKKFNGAVVRSPQYWHTWIESEGILPEENKYSWVIHYQQKDVGYFSVILDSSGWPKNGTEPGKENNHDDAKDIVLRDYVTIFSDDLMIQKCLEGVVALIMKEFNMEKTNVAHAPLLGSFFTSACTTTLTHHVGFMYKKIPVATAGKGGPEDVAIDNFLKTGDHHFWWCSDAY